MTTAEPSRPSALDHAVALVFEAVAGLGFDIGYLNGGTVGDVHVRVDDPLAAALDALAQACGESEVRARLAHLRGPICAEWLRHDSDGVAICVLPVAAEGDPCADHTPDKAAELGRCDWPFGRRQCQRPPADDGTRCLEHRDCCWIRAKKSGLMCMGTACRIPRHVRLREEHRAAAGAASR